MVLIITNIIDENAPVLLKKFPAGEATLITSRELSNTLLSINVSHFENLRIRIDGNELSVKDIKGVITLIPSIMPQELIHIEKKDRNYVCSEMNAFLIYFLSELKCIKVNEPSCNCLSGFNYDMVYWSYLAESLSIPVFPYRLKNNHLTVSYFNNNCKTIRMAGVGKEINNANDNDCCRYFSALKSKIDLSYLSASFITEDEKHYRLANVSTLPDITLPSMQDAIVNYFLNEAQ